MAYPYWLARLLVRTGLVHWFPLIDKQLDGAVPFLHYCSDRVLATPLDTLAIAADFFEIRSPDGMDLALGSPRFDLSPSLHTRLPEHRRGYPPPQGLPELRQAVAFALQSDYQLDADPIDEILITHGAAGAFTTIVDTYVNPGKRVVLFDPSSPLFSLVLRQRRARIRWVSTWMEQGHVRFRREALTSALRGARMIVLADPNNPTGGIFAPEDLEQITWWANRYDVLICHDDSFARFQYEGERARVGAFPDAAERTLTIGSVSKGHGLASARVGWIAAHRQLLRPCLLTQTLTTPFVAAVGQQVAATALRQSFATFAPVLNDFASRRQYVFERLQSMDLQPAWPAGGFFFWVSVQELGVTGRAFAERLLKEKKVLVTPGDLYGPSGTGFIRLSYAGDDGRVREGLTRLGEFVESLRAEQPAPPTINAPQVSHLEPPVAKLAPQVEPAAASASDTHPE
ncbi:MAG TPA: pyridoxal phosphate-dependent aminotransferase [Gemmataceae bacterium]|nr:pyridoxal phosphate-dependent aminotransferase [Gemmataceae bacterium]